MAIAGGAVPAYHVYLRDGKPIKIGSNHMVPGHLAYNVEQAADKLRSGAPGLYLRAYGDNWTRLQAMFNGEGKNEQ